MRRRIRCIQQRLDFLADEIRHQARTGFLEWYRQNATDLFERPWLPVLKEVKERFYRRQPDVARLWCIPVFRDSSDGRSATPPDGRLNWPKVGLARA